MTDPPYAHLLKHPPLQARSAARVEALLDAAADLLSDHEPEAVTIRDLAATAGVPTGTLYQFFEDKNAVLQALAVRFLGQMPGVLEAAADERDGGWEKTVNGVVDGYVEMIREHPAIRRLWLSGTLDAETRGLELDTDAAIADRLGNVLREQSGAGRGTPEQWRTLVALIDGLLVHVFTEDPDGDRIAIREARRAARAYAGAVLGLTPSR